MRLNERQISAVQVPSFPVAVERVADSSLIGKPVIVAPINSARSLVMAASDEVREDGVFPGMPLQQAIRLSPTAVILPPNRRLYRMASAALRKIYSNFTPLVEPHNWGNSYLDLSGTARLFGPPLDITMKIQKEIRERLNLQSAMGVASNKLTSRIASFVTKPLTIREVEKGKEASFISPYHIHKLPLVDKLVFQALQEVNLLKIGQVAAVSEAHLIMLIGKDGSPVHRQSKGIDDSPVQIPKVQPSLREEFTFAEDTNDWGLLLASVGKMTARIGYELRKRNLLMGEIRLLVVYSDEMEERGRARLRHPLFLDDDVYSASRNLFEQTVKRRIRIRMLEIEAFRLSRSTGQTEIFSESAGKEKQVLLNAAIDSIRARFGEDAVVKAEWK